MTNFANPNSLDFEKMDSDEQFDTFYLIIKIATSLGKPLPVEEPAPKTVKKKTYTPEKEILRPLIIGDGLLVIDILMSMAKTLPPEIFFCATPLRSISKTVLSDYLKVLYSYAISLTIGFSNCPCIKNTIDLTCQWSLFCANVANPISFFSLLTKRQKTVRLCDFTFTFICSYNNLAKIRYLYHYDIDS